MLSTQFPIMAGTYSLKLFLQKTLGAEKNTKINENRNVIIMLPWQLRLQ